MRKIDANSVLTQAGYAVLVAVVFCLCSLSVAEADVGRRQGTVFDPFGSYPTTEWTPPFDRSFARKWESQPPRGYPTLASKNITPLTQAIKHYANIVARGGWRSVPNVRLRLGSNRRAVAFLRRRLELSGDLRQSSHYPNTFNHYVEKALISFQARHGLTPTGYLDKRTLKALNVPASARLRQLRTNLRRVKAYTRVLPQKYVMVNIPAAQIEAIQNGHVVSRHSAVVGKVDRMTPLLQSKIHAINFNPYWTVPRSIVRKDLVPKAREYARTGKNLLKSYRISAFDNKGRRVDSRSINWSSEAIYNYTYRQDPWKENSMGFVKINFHNVHAVYMHDTPSKSLFSRNFRAQSSGCVRVQNVQQLVAWLLAGNGDWDGSRVSEVKRSGKRIDVKLKRQIPVYFVYVTAWATTDGVVQFRRDLYSKDGVDIAASSY